MVKAIKPTMGKKNEDNKPITEPVYSSPNIMGNIDMVMRIWDDYSNRTGRIRNATVYVKSKIPDKNWSPGYIRSLRSYGNRLKDAGVYKRAMEEDWDFVTISDFFRRRKEQKENIQKIKVEEPKPKVEAEPDAYKDYIKKIRPWER